ncbi:MAG TPA: LytTR family DNA-binding domain-containing protein [Vicinamibacterales bacterium]|jgi:two-component system LytT family response regulator|nr:LytTR family DNA-binding domain-containing protein [Vicinamibacterales bacterium]
MTRFRVLVADDEPLSRTLLATLLGRNEEVDAVIECGDARSARSLLAAQPFDIAFLDIEMPEASGLDLAQEAIRSGAVVVFVTAFGRYATDAFDVQAVDYVMKPFSDERLRQALERAKTRVRERKLGELANQLASLATELQNEDAAPAQPQPRYLERLALKQGDRSIVLKTADVVWIEAEDYYVLIHSKSGRHMIRTTLASLEERLDPERYLRVHRAAIVNVDEVREMNDSGGLVLGLSDGAKVSVSRSRRQRVEEILLPRERRS